MALINCPECNKEVSDTALTCPNCGYQLKKPQVKAKPQPTKRKTGGCGTLLLAVVVVVILAFLGGLIKNRQLPEKRSTPTPTVVNPYVKKYAGGYTIEVRGYSGAVVEAYALRDDGTASWMWIEPNGIGGAREVEKKTGTWNATETTITTKINGKSGLIVETYTLKNGVFVNNLSSDRYLKPSK
jgi:hypothetical protein